MSRGPGNGTTFWNVEPVGDEVIVVLESTEVATGRAVRLTISLDPFEAVLIGRTLIYARRDRLPGWPAASGA